ncbi:hypothetical protein PF008_g10608 [Phytophthora fragariae]|uniref:HTH CENPB-type domain-containing protein n=1 Tax=Phytophthora fragariae TaxID=53985 RepID=A0A6G0RTB9_9STRA|nr:hypothetical protein PF008_g10608 [Phytophthora fragariae]
MSSKQQQPKQRTFLTNAQKLQLKQFWSEHPDLQLLAVVDWVRKRFGVSVGRATLYRIYHAPVEAFTGNAQQKKGRRVKFPELERDILAFYEENRRANESSGAALSDDALLRVAAEVRARHGIPETELKLSNGWLHRFKERHALSVALQAAGEETASAQAVTDNADATQTVSESGDSGKPKRKPRATRRRINGSVTNARVDNVDINGVFDCTETEVAAEADGGRAVEASAAIQETLVASSDVTVTPLGASLRPVTDSAPAVIRPLTYLSAISVDTVMSVGFVRWKLNSGMAHTKHFSVDNDGVAVLTNAMIQLNVELQHSALLTDRPPVIFKVWAGVELLSQCESSVRSKGDQALSVLQLECTLPAQTVIRVEYHGSGVVHGGSRLVLRLLNE